MLKRSSRANVEDRWHRPPRKGDEVPYRADQPGAGCWCVDPKHGTPATLVTTVRHGQGKRWLARWVDHDGQERSKSFDRKAEAQAHITGVTAALATGTYADPRRGAITFATVAEEWFNGKRPALARKTVAGYRSLLDVVVLRTWRETRLRDMDHPAIQQWVNWLRESPDARARPPKGEEGNGPKGLSPARVVQAFQVLDQVLNYAVRARYIGVNPADDVHLPRQSSRKDKALTHEQVRSLAAAAGELSTMVYVLAYGGLRYGELAALRVKNVDVQRGRLRVTRSITYVRGDGHVEGPTKTHQERSVRLPRFVMDMLADAIRGRDESEFAFPGPHGEAMPLDYFRWRFDKACCTAGLAEVTPKTLRHTAGSLAIASGATVVTVQKLLGHQSPITTMNVYTHELPDDADNLAAALDAAARAVRS